MESKSHSIQNPKMTNTERLKDMFDLGYFAGIAHASGKPARAKEPLAAAKKMIDDSKKEKKKRKIPLTKTQRNG